MDLGVVLPLLLLAAAFYLLILRPTRTRQAAARATQAALAPGRRVMTTAGLFGTVVSIEDGEVELEIAPGVVVRYVVAAVAQVLDVPAGPDLADDSSGATGPGDARPEPGTGTGGPASSPGGDTPEG